MSTCAERMAASPAAVRTKGLEMAQLVRVLAMQAWLSELFPQTPHTLSTP